jgi:hypothetical protein
MQGTMRQNVQKTIPVHLQPPYAQAVATLQKLGPPVYLPEKFRSPLLKFFLPVTTCSCSRPASPGLRRLPERSIAAGYPSIRAGWLNCAIALASWRGAIDQRRCRKRVHFGASVGPRSIGLHAAVTTDRSMSSSIRDRLIAPEVRAMATRL